ncbi:MAG: flippase-like domain-containing protein [Chloroflexi bacterium]|nr:MAG: flippase-like domain-containing protein [Chloroflexota bacterium]
MSRARALVLGIAVSVVAAAWLVMTTDIEQVATQLARAQPLWLAPGLLVLGFQAWIRSARWASLIRTCLDIRIGIGRVIDAMLLGYFVNATMPGRLGEIARAVVVARREAVAFSGVAATVVLERAIDLMALVGLVAIALAATGSDWSVPFGALAIGIAVVVGLGRRATAFERLIPGRTPQRAADGLRSFLRSVAAIRLPVAAGAAALSAVAWLADAVMVLLVARALGIEIPVAAALAIGLGGAFGTALPAAPGYLATYELGAVTLGSFAGVPRETVLPLAILTHLIGVTVLAAAGAVALGRVSGLVRLDALNPRSAA